MELKMKVNPTAFNSSCVKIFTYRYTLPDPIICSIMKWICCCRFAGLLTLFTEKGGFKWGLFCRLVGGGRGGGGIVEVITHPQLISCPSGPNHELNWRKVGIERTSLFLTIGFPTNKHAKLLLKSRIDLELLSRYIKSCWHWAICPKHWTIGKDLDQMTI